MLLVLLASGTASAQDFTGRMVFSDGDSLRVSGARVRLFGIDAPEMDQTCTRQDGELAMRQMGSPPGAGTL